MINTQTEVLRVRIDRRDELERTLDTAVEEAIQEAIKNPGHGIRVTRHDHQTFTVELTQGVSEGMIEELDLWASA